MNLHLNEKVIIVSGGAKGIGEGICAQLALEGAFPVIIGRNEEDNQACLDKINAAGGFGYTVKAELSKPEECERAIKDIHNRFGKIHGLVNNAGLNDGVSLESGNYEGFMQSLHNNLVHYYLLAHHALPALKETKGSIVNITSKVAETGQGGTSGYAAANGGRNALTREWAVELLKYGIRVNAVVVAESYTPMYDRWIKSLPDGEKQLKEINNRIPLGNRMTTVEELANMVVFLLSKRSSHTTGQIMHVDGGYVHLDRSLIKK
ncbi:SDR family oxidoreductase [Arcticibacterium luteifluviistationis]|uniref:Short chain dehydrogenase n=1 Tax=Arcticibacterium luteifluviistationis TaxID=1784714 RepID=A0A2Z4GF32_9BACT|nr:SDR family oxidoreductase [Arcticibacterium luteifluviistationis]AWV99982.1 short chain dehydrogenase [Arcticibacterium luteifluviistationis]